LVFGRDLQVAADHPRPRRRPGEALIRVLAAGICGTDLEITEGYRGFRGVLGHEFVGRVVEADTLALHGTRVCGEINISCLDCSMCARGLTSHCVRRAVMGISGHDGCFADYLVLPDRNLHAVPDLVTDEAATFVEPLAAAFEIVDQVQLQDMASMAILGDGRLAAVIGLVLSALGHDPLVIGKHQKKLDRLSGMGLRTMINTRELPKDLDLIVEATGSGSGLETALQIARPRGTVVMKTTAAKKSPVDLSVAVVKELNLIGSRCGPFRPAIEALAANRIDVEPLVTHRFDLVDGVDAFHRAREKDAHKVLLHISD